LQPIHHKSDRLLAYRRIAYIKLTLTTAGKVVIQFKEK